MNIKRELSKRQSDAVYHYKGPLLVLAGPGSGKTRVITYRVAYLVHIHNIPPSSILAVTFTNKAAQEMITRLHDNDLLGETIGADVWIHTFHAVCVRILRKYGDKIGLNPRFAILDQDSQEELLSQFIRDSNSTISMDQVWLVREFISDAKIRLKDPLEAHESERLRRINERNDNNPLIVEIDLGDVLEIAKRYQEYLKNHNVLDFDDLVSITVELLAKNTDVREELQAKFKFIMVDEYQDINQAQYQLISYLCSSERNIIVVADDDQSIYSWRGSDPTFIEKFKEQYNPKIIQLVDHYRSTQKILKASQTLIERNTRIKKSSLTTNNEEGEVIYYYKLDDAKEEMRLIRWLIRQLINNKYYSPGQIAIFYRTHRLADKLEQFLIESKIPIRRIRRNVFMNQSSVRSIISYLRLINWQLEPDLERAINFPDMIVDELTKQQLAKLSSEKMDLFELFKNIVSQDVAPLTKSRIQHFAKLLDDLRELQNEGSANKIVNGLIEMLDFERSPYHTADLSAIKNPQSYGSLQKAVNALYDIIRQRKPIKIIANYGIDNYCSAGIINYVLTNYFDMEDKITLQFLSQDEKVVIEKQNDDESWNKISDITYIVMGSEMEIPSSIAKNTILIGALDESEDDRYIASLLTGEGGVVTTITLKMCQRLMISYEAGSIEGLIVYDLETIGNNPKTAEIIEIAGKKLGVRRRKEEDQDPFFHRRVKPTKSIPKSSTDIHGITNQDVADKPSIEKVLPEFLKFVSDSILVGHNIIEFDNKIISRYMASRLDKAEITNRSYDTLTVAKKLFPLENYKLDAIADKFGIEYKSEDLHHADKDIAITESVFRSLRREELSRNERACLKEALPLVALGILSKNAVMEEENSAFYNASLRYMKHKKGRSDAIEILPISHLEAEEEEDAIGFLDRMTDEAPPFTEDDEVWNSIVTKVQNSVIEYERNSYDNSLTSFLSHTALLTGSDSDDDKQDKVTMMTVHSAKGTEFPIVIMMGMEQGNFPIISRDQSESELEEERRLCYVGITRAKRRLYLTSARFRDSDRESTPSQFIWEIRPDLIRTVTAKQVRSAWDKSKKTAVSK
jgi:DNA helicase-2/ATP-dependent DNA helicase PcrA